MSVQSKKATIIDAQLKTLEVIFNAYSGTITAFSGGVDSSLVLFLSRKFLGRNRTLGVISKSESLKSKDYEIATMFAEEHDINLITIATKELYDSNYSSNPSNRCYICKSHLYDALIKIAEQNNSYTILNGTNTDDMGDYRPGLQAASEHYVDSPLFKANMNKEDIRKMAKHFGLSVWDKPASPCLSSRVPYGHSITNHKLRQIEEAENILNKFGFQTVRVRHYGEICRIEVPTPQVSELINISPKIIPQIRELGFEKCLIDDEGFISGKLNRSIL